MPFSSIKRITSSFLFNKLTWYSYTSFKIPTKKESFISFINGSNNKIIVVDKLGNYTLAELNMNKEAKIIKRDLLI